jgi:hypothetical protein
LNYLGYELDIALMACNKCSLSFLHNMLFASLLQLQRLLFHPTPPSLFLNPCPQFQAPKLAHRQPFPSQHRVGYPQEPQAVRPEEEVRAMVEIAQAASIIPRLVLASRLTRIFQSQI